MIAGINKYILNIKMCIDAVVYMAIFDSHQIMMSRLNQYSLQSVYNAGSHLKIRYVYCITQMLRP